MTEAPQAPQGQQAAAGEKKPGNGLAVAGMILGIISAALCWVICLPFVAVLVGVVGLILSILGLSKAKKVHAGAGAAKAGLICSIIGIVAHIVIWLVFVVFAASASKSMESDWQKMMEDATRQAPEQSSLVMRRHVA